jgi:transcriptional regulator GlxA family with amidase domain
MIIAVGLYQGFTALDAMGPYEVLTYLPDAEMVIPHTEWTTSVCTGALVLGAAGLLNGLPATTHWSAYDALASYGAQPTEQRVVTAGRIMTGAGVSAGIDLALTLAAKIAGPEVAQCIQLAIEYDPHPPFDAGSPSKAPKPIYDMAVAALGD